MKRTRIYIDTSVVGGCFDEAFAKESLALMQAAREGRIVLLLSDLLGVQLRRASPQKRSLLARLPSSAVERVLRNSETRDLRNCYLKAGVLGPRFATDAHHVALATVWYAELLVSCNFKHIVHWDIIRKFNSVNLWEGYRLIEVRPPKQVV
jgi:hypothetical protein